MERRIIGALRGESHHDFSAILGWKALQADVADFGAEHEFTKLVPDLRDRDPDDAFSVVPYEKGYHFLYYLERLFGREAWDKFIPHVNIPLYNGPWDRSTDLSDGSTLPNTRRRRSTPLSSRQPYWRTSPLLLERRRSWPKLIGTPGCTSPAFRQNQTLTLPWPTSATRSQTNGNSGHGLAASHRARRPLSRRRWTLQTGGPCSLPSSLTR